jgi:hypothetical protein
MNRRQYPLQNRLTVYLGFIILTGVAFPPILFVTVPLLVNWYRIEKQHELAKTIVQVQLMSAAYTKAEWDRESQMIAGARFFKNA